MRSNKILLSAIIIAGVSALFLWFRRSATPSRETLPAHPKRNLREAFEGSRAPIKVVVPATDADTADCIRLWTEMGQVELRGWNGGSLPNPSGCGRLSTLLGNFSNDYQAQCAKFFSKGALSSETWRLAACKVSFAMFRAMLTKWRFSGADVSTISDPGVLLDLLLTTGIGEDKPNVQSQNELRILNRLWEVDASLKDLAKYALTLSIAGLIEKGNQDSSNEENAQRWYERAEATDARDPELSELRLIIDTGGLQLSRLEPEAQRLASQGPPSGLGYFYLAAITSMKAHPSNVVKYLEMASALEPSNTRFRISLDSMRKTGHADFILPTHAKNSFDMLLDKITD